MPLDDTRRNDSSVTVIIPVYGITSFLQETIKSVFAQQYPKQDIIVVDDGSAPQDALVIDRLCHLFPDVTLLREPHAGAACARRAGVARARGEFVLFLDADDIMLPGTLDYFVGVMQRNPGAVATYGRLQNIDAAGNLTGEPARPPVEQMLSGKALLHALLEHQLLLYNGTVCMRRQALQKIAPLNHGIRLGEDWVLWCHLALEGDIIPAGDRVVLHYRRHEGNVSSTLWDHPEVIFRAIDSVFSDEKFKRAIDAKELDTLYRRGVSRMHAFLASGYAKRMQHDKARYHLMQAGEFLSTLGT